MTHIMRILVALTVVAVAGTCPAQVFLRDIPAPSESAASIAWDGGAFWIGDNTSTLYRISVEDGTVLRTITGPTNGFDGLVWDGTHLRVVSGVNSDPTIYAIDTTDGTVVSTIPDPTFGYSGGVAFDGTSLWMSRRFPGNTINEVDPSDGSVLTTYPWSHDTPWGMAYDGEMLWNGTEDDTADRIFRIDPADGSEAWTFELPPNPQFEHRRVRGLTWVGESLWFVAFQSEGTQIAIHEYDVSNAVNPDVEIIVDSYEFGGHVVGFPAQWTARVTNIGNVILQIFDADFVVDEGYELASPTTFPVEISSFDTVDFVIEFAPPVDGDYPDTLDLSTNDPDEDPARIHLSGVGWPDEGDIATIPNSLDFGTVWIPNPGLSTARTLEVHNFGYGVLTVTDVSVTTGQYFRLEPVTYPVEIDSQDHFDVRVWFEPDAVGFWDGILTVLSDDPDEPLVDVIMSGNSVQTAFEAGDVIWYYLEAPDVFDNGVNAINWINDVSGDGIADVIASAGNDLTFCLNGASSEIGDTLWKYNTGSEQMHSGCVYWEAGLSSIPDITGDEIDDVILGTTGGDRSVHAVNGATGEQLWTFDTRYWDEGGWVNAVAPISDLDNDFVTDVVVAGGVGSGSSGPRRIFALSGIDGDLIWEGPQFSGSFYAVAALADVTGDNVPDVVGGTSSWAVGINGATGLQMWQANIEDDSPVFELVNMGNANPDVNLSEDVAVASAYDGIYVIDGGTGAQIWRHEITGTSIYEVAAGSDITGDDVREVYAGTVSGYVLCLDGATGAEIWTEPADANDPSNVLSMTTMPDITGDGINDVVCGTLSDVVVVLNGWNGAQYFSTFGQGPFDAIDATGMLPDIDNNGSWEVLAGNRDGVIQVLAGGSDVTGPEGWISGTVREFGQPLPIPDAEVTVVETQETVLTDASGVYTVNLPPGTYSLTVHKQGYCDESFEGLVVTEDLTTTQNVTLREPNVHFSATSFNVIAPVGTIQTEEFEISNPGGSCPVTYSISDTSEWITVNPETGDVPANDADLITVTLDLTDLEIGEHRSELLIAHNDENSPHEISIFVDVISSADGRADLPTEFRLHAAYPNPFNPVTTIRYDLAAQSPVLLDIHDILGREVARLVDRYQPQGRYVIEWNGTSSSGMPVGSGTYLLRLTTPEYSSTQRVTLIK